LALDQGNGTEALAVYVHPSRFSCPQEKKLERSQGRW